MLVVVPDEFNSLLKELEFQTNIDALMDLKRHVSGTLERRRKNDRRTSQDRVEISMSQLGDLEKALRFLQRVANTLTRLSDEYEALQSFRDRKSEDLPEDRDVWIVDSDWLTNNRTGLEALLEEFDQIQVSLMHLLEEVIRRLRSESSGGSLILTKGEAVILSNGIQIVFTTLSKFSKLRRGMKPATSLDD